MKVVNKPLRKKDAMQLVTGQPVYMDDVIPEGCLCVKLLRSPHANAIVESINTAAAMKVPGMERIFTWEDVPQDGRRYTQAGQTYPEASPYDRLVIDRHVRFVGDVVAIVAGEDEKCVDKAMRLIKVKYKVLEPLFDFTKAKDNPILVHPEDNWESLAPVGADNKRNLCAHDQCGSGDIDEVLRTSDIVIDRVYHTRACQQAMMETFRTYCSIDAYGRLNVLSSTQIVFHTRRIIANALHIPKSMIRVSKPRIGGGFGAKQTAVSAVYPAFVTWMTKKPSKIIFSRVESQTASSPRHEMQMHVRLGATKDGIVRGIDLYYYPGSTDGLRMANILADNLREIYPLPQRVRPLASTSITEIRRVRAPSVLAELGYHDNRADAEWIENNLEAIARSLTLSVTEYFGVPFLSPRPEREGVVSVNSGNLLLRGAPATTARILARMPNGAPVRILNSYDDWSVVDYDGLLGWAKSEYLRPLP